MVGRWVTEAGAGLKQDLCLAKADGETEEAGGFCKLVDDDLDVRLPIRHEGTVVQQKVLTGQSFSVFVLAVSRQRFEQGAVKPIS